MFEYTLSCCSTVDLTPEHLEHRDIRWVPFHFQLDGKDYLDDFGQTIPFDLFYQKLANGSDACTSQVNVHEFKVHFSKLLNEGKDVFHVCLSSGLSGVTNSAEIAASQLMEEQPGSRIIVVDSLGASSGYGLIMDKLADLRDGGMDIDSLHAWLLEHRLNMNHWFFSTDLKYYVKGGRISKAASVAVSVLKICPLLNMDNQGKLVPREKIRTKSKTMTTTLQRIIENAEDGLEYSGKVYICHSACAKEAKKLAHMIEEKFVNLAEPIKIFSVGTAIGSHTGPGTVSVFFWGNKRID